MITTAFIGCGPMALYALKRLVAGGSPVCVRLYERTGRCGSGMPYSAALNTDEMLSNAFSREIPPVTRPLIDWLRDQDDTRLARWGVTAEDTASREFYPRTLLGAYFEDEFDALCTMARARGHEVIVHPRHEVRDIVHDETGVLVLGRAGELEFEHKVDHVLLTTGHAWPTAPEIGGAALRSPWPAASLEALPAGHIGVIGASLSAIDVALTLGARHGTFENGGAEARWFARDGSEDFRLTLLSTRGVMPEADFYYPFPYEPLAHLTEEHVDDEIARDSAGLLERVFELLVRDLEEADPDWIATLGSNARTIDGFGPAYFAQRAQTGGFRAVRESFAAARDAMASKELIPHRYVLLRADALFDRILRHLDEAAYARFRECLLPVFADAYASVPHRSVSRLIAMHNAGVLDLQATGDGARYRMDEIGVIHVALDGLDLRFDAVVDARGQQSAGLRDMPFPSLAARLGDRPLRAPFRLASSDGIALPIHCLSMPQLLERYPFSQGLSNCANLAAIVVDDLLAGSAAKARPEERRPLQPAPQPPLDRLSNHPAPGLQK